MFIKLVPYLLLIGRTLCQTFDVCTPAEEPLSPVRHVYAEDNLEVSRVSFSSCHMPEEMEKVQNFWSDVRSVSQPDLWLWLGDNMYKDGNDINAKRLQYNKVKNEPTYKSYGPVAEDSPIPIMAGWDDHDYGYNDAGSDYPCKEESQAEWAYFTNIPTDAPQHPESPSYRPGIYNSRMFNKPGTQEKGIHVIILDNRSERDPTYSRFGECKGSDTQILSDDQWSWFESELDKESEIKIIGSGVQVLPPTDQITKFPEQFCAHDSHNGDSESNNNTFMEAIDRVGESKDWYGVPYEMWGEVPLQRERLLGMTQKAINNKKTKLVIFVSGDPHWAEFMAKKMPESDQWGPSQILYEVTASGVPQDWPGWYLNSNRLRDRSADHRGEGPFNQKCAFPFVYKDVEYTDCTDVDNDGIPWCSVFNNAMEEEIPTFWGNCAPPELELAQETFSNSTRTCSRNPYFICTAVANYGFINVDFDAGTVEMTVRTPAEGEQMSHIIKY